MIKVGMVGYGFSAKTFHLPLIEVSSDFELVAISSSQTEAVVEKYPEITLFPTAEELIQSSDSDIVVITAPNDVHFSLAKLALENGKHVILEKPMAATSDEAEQLGVLAKQNQLILSVFHNRRWDGDFLTVQQLINNNQLGDIRYFESHFDRHRPDVRERWKELPGPGGGVWFDLGAHLVDQALVLFGLPQSLTARCLALRDGSQATDYFHVVLHYQNREVVLHSSPYTTGPNMRFHIQGTEASYIKYGLDPQESQLKGGVYPNDSDFGYEAEEAFGNLHYAGRYKEVETEPGRYLSYYDAIANALKHGEPVPVSSDDAAMVIKILELAEESSHSGKTIAIGDTV